MAEETLLTAARRVVRFLNIDLNKGGLVTEDTEKALSTLDKQVRRVVEQIKAEGEVRITEEYGCG